MVPCVPWPVMHVPRWGAALMGGAMLPPPPNAQGLGSSQPESGGQRKKSQELMQGSGQSLTDLSEGTASRSWDWEPVSSTRVVLSGCPCPGFQLLLLEGARRWGLACVLVGEHTAVPSQPLVPGPSAGVCREGLKESSVPSAISCPVCPSRLGLGRDSPPGEGGHLLSTWEV